MFVLVCGEDFIYWEVVEVLNVFVGIVMSCLVWVRKWLVEMMVVV